MTAVAAGPHDNVTTARRQRALLRIGDAVERREDNGLLDELLRRRRVERWNEVEERAESSEDHDDDHNGCPLENLLQFTPPAAISPALPATIVNGGSCPR